MADADAEWSSSSNDAFHISLVTPGDGGPTTLHSFNPAMTYSIFGENESIFGYQGLKIDLRYNACDMYPGLQITYNKKYKTVGEVEATDLKAILEPYLPKPAFEKSSVFEKTISQPLYTTWTPRGELWKTIQSGEKTYEVWKASLADPAVQQMLKRIQILVPLFIEGGTFIELEDPEWSLERWTVFFLYQKDTSLSAATPPASPYVFMGYSTVYRYFYYQPSKEDKSTKNEGFELPPEKEIEFSSLPCRSRISQFIILPPFQGGGNGARFYNAIFDFYLQQPQTIEITVEDPNEAFDDLRDLNDLARLRALPEFSKIHINSEATPRAKGPVPRDILDLEALEQIRHKMKISPRQFNRVVEMHLLAGIPEYIRQALLVEHEKKKSPERKEKENEYKLWQLVVKKRLYKHNKDTLMQLDRVERIEKLEQVLGGVEADYARLLKAFEKRAGVGSGKGLVIQNGRASVSGAPSLTVAAAENESESRASSVGRKSKRSSPDGDEGEPAGKRTKLI